MCSICVGVIAPYAVIVWWPRLLTFVSLAASKRDPLFVYLRSADYGLPG
jgi:hypothetical protein